MADNYLDKKLEEYRNRSQAGAPARRQGTLVSLLTKNRSCRGYDESFIVRDDQLRSIIEVNTLIPSARNQQVLRFRPVNSSEAHKILPHIRLGSALPELTYSSLCVATPLAYDIQEAIARRKEKKAAK